MGASKHRSDRPYRRARALMFLLMGTTCWICGHPGGREADHLDPVSLDPDQPVDVARMRPSHGSHYPCTDPECVARKGKPRSCNQERGAKPLSTATEVGVATKLEW